MITKHLLPSEGLAREQFVVTIMIKLVSVLRHMKERGIVHGDLHGTQTLFADAAISIRACFIYCNITRKLHSCILVVSLVCLLCADGNIIVTRDGSIKVIDFGSSRVCNNLAVHPQLLEVPGSSSLSRSSR